MTRFENHQFYCTKCGNRGLPVWRNPAAQRGKGHLKKLYCIYCQEEVNHYECYNQADVEKFKRKFENGDFDYDSVKSDVRSPSVGKNALY